MPLVLLTTKPKFHPRDDDLPNLPQQAMTADFAEALPALFVANIEEFHMDADTPEAGVQVTHRKFHRRDVNAPDMWILIEFSEDSLDELQKSDVTTRIQKLLLGWFQQRRYNLPTDFACDVRWSPSHGFLNIGGTVVEW